MRATPILVPILLVSFRASADDNVPQACRSLDVVPTATTNRPTLSAEISVASCAATERLRSLTLTDDLASVRALDDAAAPSVAMYDDVISRGDTEQQIIALHAKADLLLGLQTRMRMTISSAPPYAEAQHRRDRLDAMIPSWRTTALESFDRITALVEGEPGIERRDAVVGFSIHVARLERPAVAIATP